jgi:hypothetical protein
MLKPLLLSLLLLLPLASEAYPSEAAVTKAEQATIALRAKGPDGPIFCTAVAVGPHLVQTNLHCYEIARRLMSLIWMDNQGVSSSCMFDKIVANDGRDNILIETRRSWDVYVERATSVKMHSQVFQFGYPGGEFLTFRTGTLAGKKEMKEAGFPKAEALMFNLNSLGGDSGGGIFDEEGKLICTTSFIWRVPANAFKMTGGFQSKFPAILGGSYGKAK